jgi:hypothetical protein
MPELVHTALAELSFPKRMSVLVEAIAASIIADVPEEAWIDTVVTVNRDVIAILEKASTANRKA